MVPCLHGPSDQPSVTKWVLKPVGVCSVSGYYGRVAWRNLGQALRIRERCLRLHPCTLVETIVIAVACFIVYLVCRLQRLSVYEAGCTTVGSSKTWQYAPNASKPSARLGSAARSRVCTGLATDRRIKRTNSYLKT